MALVDCKECLGKGYYLAYPEDRRFKCDECDGTGFELSPEQAEIVRIIDRILDNNDFVRRKEFTR